MIAPLHFLARASAFPELIEAARIALGTPPQDPNYGEVLASVERATEKVLSLISHDSPAFWVGRDIKIKEIGDDLNKNISWKYDQPQNSVFDDHLSAKIFAEASSKLSRRFTEPEWIGVLRFIRRESAFIEGQTVSHLAVRFAEENPLISPKARILGIETFRQILSHPFEALFTFDSSPKGLLPGQPKYFIEILRDINNAIDNEDKEKTHDLYEWSIEYVYTIDVNNSVIALVANLLYLSLSEVLSDQNENAKEIIFDIESIISRRIGPVNYGRMSTLTLREGVADLEINDHEAFEGEPEKPADTDAMHDQNERIITKEEAQEAERVASAYRRQQARPPDYKKPSSLKTFQTLSSFDFANAALEPETAAKAASFVTAYNRITKAGFKATEAEIARFGEAQSYKNRWNYQRRKNLTPGI